MAAYSERLRMLRLQSGLSQMRLSKLVGVSQVAINRYEHGDAEPPYRVLLWYADSFNVSLDWLLCRTDEPRGKLYAGMPPADGQERDFKGFIDACFVPNAPMNMRLKEKLLELWRDNSSGLKLPGADARDNEDEEGPP